MSTTERAGGLDLSRERPAGPPRFGWAPRSRDVSLLGLLALLVVARPAKAQSVEVLVGHQRVTEDVMFFRFFERPAEAPGGPRERSDAGFFFRARAGAGWRASDAAPQFGLTSALSWSPPALAGFAPVLVGQALGKGLFAKAGLQFARVTARLTVFAWVVGELRASPAFDAFVLGRYVHPLGGPWGLFLQAEALATSPTRADAPLAFTERLRAGLQFQRFQLGPALDVSHLGRGDFTHTLNLGGFVRTDF